MRDRVHDRPLLRRRVQTPLRLLLGELDDARPADVHAELLGGAGAVDPDPAPDDLPRLADPGEGRAAEAEIHRRLAVAVGPFPAADEVGRRRAA